MMLALEYLIYHVKPFGGDSNIWFIPEREHTTEKSGTSPTSSLISQMAGNNILFTLYNPRD